MPHNQHISHAYPIVNIPLSLDQIAVGLRQLSEQDIETLELLMDTKAMKTIQKGLEEEKNGKLRQL